MLANLLAPIRAEYRNILTVVLCATVISAAAVVAMMFVAIAVFLWVSDAYGAVEACLAMAAFFVAVALIAMIVLLAVQGRKQRRAAVRAAAEPTKPPPWLDPAMIPVAVEAARLVLRNRNLLFILLGSVAVGWLATRKPAEATEEPVAEPAE